MYNYGLVKFLQAKKLSSKECINAFLKSEGCDFEAKNHNRVNDYIQNNWSQFASFCDKGLKNGTLKGKAIKLNTHFDEQLALRNRIKEEFKNANLTLEQELLLNEIKENGAGKIQSVMMKAGISPVKKNLEYASKKLQWLPLVNQAIENGITTLKSK